MSGESPACTDDPFADLEDADIEGLVSEEENVPKD